MTAAPLKNSFNEPSRQEIEDFIEAAGREDDQKTVMKLLDKYGASIIDASAEYDGWTALMCAAMLGNRGMVELLLEKGAAVDKRDNKGMTALMRAAMCDNHLDEVLEVAELLLEKGADIHAESYSGATALSLAEFFGPARTVVFLKKEWPEKQRQRLEKKRAQWLKDTDCSRGLEKPLRAPRPLNPFKKSPAI